MDPYQLGITEACAAIADGRLPARDYLESCIARTIAVEPTVHAYAHFDADAVRQVSARSDGHGPLTGIPVGIKDIIATRGIPTEFGSAAFRGHVPDRSAWVIDALDAASALMFGKTVTTEFAWRHPGATRNPWNPGHTPGGSSSGSAAAVAYGSVPAALGTQTLGSVLRPAAYCGVVGYKPSFGAIPRSGVHPVAASLDHIGVFTRSVIDAARLASVLFGRDGGDPVSGPSPASPWPLGTSMPHPRVALLRTSMWMRVSREQQVLVESVAGQLARSGALVTPFELPADFDTIWSTAQTLCAVEGGAVSSALADEKPPRVGQPTIDLVASGRAVSALDYKHAKDLQRTMIHAFTTIMASFDVVLTAPALGEAPAGLDDTGDAVFCTPFNLFGAPAITLPAGTSANGLPLGIQLAGAWNEDRSLLEVAAWVERVLAWSHRFPLV